MKAIACGLPREHGLPLSRFSRAELHRLVIERGLTCIAELEGIVADCLAQAADLDAIPACTHALTNEAA